MEKNLLCQTCKTSGKADGDDHWKVWTTATDSAEPEVVSTQKLEPLRVRSAGHMSYLNFAFSQGCLPALKERKKTQEDSRGVFNHFSLQQILEQKNLWMPTACIFSAQVILCQGPRSLLFALSNSKCVCRSLLCILSRASLVYISLVWGNSEASNLTNGRSALIGKQAKSTFCWATSGRTKLEQNYARPRTAYLQSGNLLGAW